MKIRDLDMFGMLTIIFSRPVRTIKDLGLNIDNRRAKTL